MREGDSFQDIHEQDRQREGWAAWHATVCTAGEDLRTALRHNTGYRARGKYTLEPAMKTQRGSTGTL
jgi:hypothetical protein